MSSEIYSVLPQFYLSEFEGVIVSPPCAPVHTISKGGVWFMKVETIEIWQTLYHQAPLYSCAQISL